MKNDESQPEECRVYLGAINNELKLTVSTQNYSISDFKMNKQVVTLFNGKLIIN